MSDDLDTTDPLPRRDTAPILEEILANVRELRGLPAAVAALDARLATLEAKVDRGFDDMRAELSRTRATFRDLVTEEARTAADRLDAHEKRLRTLEDRERPQ